MADNDEIDLETLQARIDLSMSFTHDLVSSWVKPTPNSNKSSSSKNMEKILQEEMRRPPRLGVGASVSDYNTLSSRETARLKGHLLSNGKKRSREDEDPQPSTSKQTLEDSDEGESRAGAIRKKPKIDPFAAPSKEKRKKETLNGALSVKPRLSTPTEASSSTVGVTITEEAVTGRVTSEKKREKKRKNAVALASNGGASTAVSSKSDSSNDNNSTQETSKPSLLSPSRTTPFSLKTAPKIPSDLPTSLLKQPLLNLEGPVFEKSDDESPDNLSPADAPKKKKRRKKKKKKHPTFEGSSEQAKTS
ncbi:hypothetical protein ARMGADRAFT_1158869 [Armillaria gallica]|uniref:Uncharacterized protein n=1 Tax=Armillaria gallica TaxID=47427 RepID=A0A2H3E7I2_ARMGA|nr:hypothetical protein ARMGADRAFT_1158869 [Armillaria gallica]